MPRAGQIRFGQTLKRHVPATVSAFDDIDQSGVISFVAIVVGSKQVAVFVEDDLLRIPEASHDDFHFASVGQAAKNRAIPRTVQSHPFAGSQMETAIAD